MDIESIVSELEKLTGVKRTSEIKHALETNSVFQDIFSQATATDPTWQRVWVRVVSYSEERVV